MSMPSQRCCYPGSQLQSNASAILACSKDAGVQVENVCTSGTSKNLVTTAHVGSHAWQACAALCAALLCKPGMSRPPLGDCMMYSNAVTDKAWSVGCQLVTNDQRSM